MVPSTQCMPPSSTGGSSRLIRPARPSPRRPLPSDRRSASNRPMVALGREPQEDVLERALAALASQLRDRALGEQAPVVEDADAVADLFGGLEHVRAEQDRGAARGLVAEQVLQCARAARVEA